MTRKSEYRTEKKTKGKKISINTLLYDAVCPKCKFEPMIKVNKKYNCEMCGYVDRKQLISVVS